MPKRTVIAALCLLSLIVASLAYAVPVNGRVVNKDGAPKSQVKVELSAGDRQYSAWTDEDGRFSIADVAEGSYKAKVAGGAQEYDVKIDGSGMHPNPLVVD